MNPLRPPIQTELHTLSHPGCHRRGCTGILLNQNYSGCKLAWMCTKFLRAPLLIQLSLTHLAFSGLVSCTGVQVMIRALRFFIHVVDQAWGVCNRHLLILSACSVPVALSLRCCRRILPQCRRPSLIDNLILYGNCRTNMLLLLS